MNPMSVDRNKHTTVWFQRCTRHKFLKNKREKRLLKLLLCYSTASKIFMRILKDNLIAKTVADYILESKHRFRTNCIKTKMIFCPNRKSKNSDRNIK